MYYHKKDCVPQLGVVFVREEEKYVQEENNDLIHGGCEKDLWNVHQSLRKLIPKVNKVYNLINLLVGRRQATTRVKYFLFSCISTSYYHGFFTNFFRNLGNLGDLFFARRIVDHLLGGIGILFILFVIVFFFFQIVSRLKTSSMLLPVARLIMLFQRQFRLFILDLKIVFFDVKFNLLEINSRLIFFRLNIMRSTFVLMVFLHFT